MALPPTAAVTERTTHQLGYALHLAPFHNVHSFTVPVYTTTQRRRAGSWGCVSRPGPDTVENPLRRPLKFNKKKRRLVQLLQGLYGGG